MIIICQSLLSLVYRPLVAYSSHNILISHPFQNWTGSSQLNFGDVVRNVVFSVTWPWVAFCTIIDYIGVTILALFSFSRSEHLAIVLFNDVEMCHMIIQLQKKKKKKTLKITKIYWCVFSLLFLLTKEIKFSIFQSYLLLSYISICLYAYMCVYIYMYIWCLCMCIHI